MVVVIVLRRNSDSNRIHVDSIAVNLDTRPRSFNRFRRRMVLLIPPISVGRLELMQKRPEIVSIMTL